MNRYLRAAAALAIACMALAIPAAAERASQAVLDAQRSVVRIVSYDPGAEDSWIGTGFVISQDEGYGTWVITNRHVVENDRGEEIPIYILLTDINGTKLPAAVYYIDSDDPTLDLVFALVEKGLENRKPLPLAPVETVNKGDRVYALGFPGVADDATDNGGLLPSRPDDVTLTSGVVSKTNAEYNGWKFIQSDVAINGGNSGGPMLDEDGAVIGINSFGMQAGGAPVGVNGAYWIDYIIDTCEQSDIPYTLAGVRPVANTAPDPTTARETTRKPEPITMPPPIPPAPFPWGIAAICALLLLVIIGVAMVLLLRKKKNAPAPAPASEAIAYGGAPAPAQRGVPCACGIVGTGGQFRELRFPVTGRVAIGRDPQRSHIVFDKTAAGVSGLHCEVRNDNGALQLTDLGSSYGTFLQSGKRLEANAPETLRPGDGFYLGARANGFQVY